MGLSGIKIMIYKGIKKSWRYDFFFLPNTVKNTDAPFSS